MPPFAVSKWERVNDQQVRALAPDFSPRRKRKLGKFSFSVEYLKKDTFERKEEQYG
jgi:hypothetical protein